MRTSRRHLIKLGLCATASLATFEGLSGVALAAEPNEAAANDDGAWLRRDMFEASVGQQFVVRTRSRSWAMRLIRVEDVLSAQHAGTVGHQDCFTVLLRGSRLSRLAQGTYRVENATLGEFPLFLVPGPASAAGITYAATFNRVGTE